jgi:hypothetical protein
LKNVLIIFVRNPELGKVKTRLARTLGDDEALRIYRYLLEKTREAALAVEAGRMLFYSDNIPETDEWSVDYFIKKNQEEGDLGARMAAAFETAFEEGAGKVLIIGSDCPDLNGDILDSAFKLLDQHDFVIGPVPDGGYYLLGMKQPTSTVFENIVWSTDTVRAHTLEKIAALGKTCAALPMLTDIDEAEDWYRQLSSWR